MKVEFFFLLGDRLNNVVFTLILFCLHNNSYPVTVTTTVLRLCRKTFRQVFAPAATPL